MEVLKNKIVELKKKQFISSKQEFFKSIFGDGFIDMILMKDFQQPDINTIISFLETTKKREINYRMLPTIVLEIEEEKDDKINESIIAFFETESVYMLFSYVFESTEEVSGYINVDKRSFAENLHKLSINYGFCLNANMDKFIYYSESKDTQRTYLYKGLIVDKKYIRILN